MIRDDLLQALHNASTACKPWAPLLQVCGLALGCNGLSGLLTHWVRLGAANSTCSTQRIARDA